MSTHLTLAQRALLTSELEQRQVDLDRQIAAELGGSTRVEHAREVLLQDGDDAPARDADREVDLARSDQDMNELRAVKEALLRLQGGKYGLCADCGEEIPFARLQHSPEATRCVACQTAFESLRGSAHRASI
jgi:DnaK suppressor protein